MNPTTAVYDDIVNEQNMICLHSWFARKLDKQNLERIHSIYELSKILKAKYD